MKTFCLALSLLPAIALAAEPATVASRITDVTVYADRAQVTRTADVPLTPGENRIRLAELPAALEDESVRAAGKAAAPVTIQDVEVRTVVREQAADATAKELEGRVLALKDESAALDARQRVLDQQRKFLGLIEVKAAADVSRDVQINKFDLAQLKELPAFMAAETARLEDEAQQIIVARRQLQPRIEAAEAEFNKHRAAATKASKTVIVTVNASEATKLQLQVSYVLGGASWAPTYDARAATDAGHVEFTYNGIVRQQTGEDWRGVNLTLSTARPAIGAQMPALEKWTVGFAPPAPLGGQVVLERVMDNRLAAKPAGALRTAGEGLTPVRQELAQIEYGATSATFRVPRAADVPSDGEPHRQTIAVQSLPASFRYETTPKLSPAAYLKATATNTTDAPFLAGVVNVFVGPDFIGAGRLETVAPMEAIKVFLGADDAIRVKREELKERRGKSGLFNRRHKQVFAYKITVENFKDKPQTVAVFDQLPVPGDDDIKVALADNSTRPTETEASTGKLTWEFTLKPRDKREILYEFSVDWPQDRPVTGL
jgi:uncharacterized protein (TIGR02231 family)